tara:strand:+ start:24 stop:344 length:321 start_codon:yes stop_codon:yes gene_type:complete
MGVTIKDIDNYKSINNINFGEVVVFFRFGAEWCIPCIELDKVLVNIPESIIYHISIDNENFESLLTEMDVYTIPDTIVKYKNLSRRFKGVRTTEEIMKLIEDLKNA